MKLRINQHQKKTQFPSMMI